jgi:LmbE family N-acetylglucosaminyl deacetylase
MNTAGDFHRAWRGLPIGRLDDIIGDGWCLILAPHPDDESLGCGGLIAACVAAGRMPLVVVLTDGAGSHPNSRTYPPERLREVRAQEVRGAVGCLGLPSNRIVFLGEPDAAAPHGGPRLDAVARQLVKLVRAGCTAILAPWRHDPHCDHEAASLAAAAAARAAGIRHVAYPVWGWTLPADRPVPERPGGGWRLAIDASLGAKRRAIQAHRTQYGGLITDDPAGFQLPAALLSVFDTPFETFLETGQHDRIP